MTKRTKRSDRRPTEELNGFVENAQLVAAEAVLEQLFGHQVAHCDVQLLFVSVTRHLDDLHAVEQRRRNSRQRVGGRDEQHLRQVERNVQVAASRSVTEYNDVPLVCRSVV